MQRALDEDLENPACPLCGGDATTAKRYALDRYGVVRCASCRLWYLRPRLQESAMLKLYASDSYFQSPNDSGYSSYIAQQESLRNTFRRFVRQLHTKGFSGGRLLEVGCGYGYLLEQAEPYFSYRLGTDYSREALQQAAPRCDETILGGVDEVPAGQTFDLIVTVGVIEHIYRPLEFNGKLWERLNKGGKLIHATPDMGSFWRHIMGSRWASFKVPEHVAFYDRNTLSELFTRSGFRKLQRLNFPHAFPLSLVAEKFGVRAGSALGAFNVWLPATTLALVGHKSDRCCTPTPCR